MTQVQRPALWTALAGQLLVAWSWSLVAGEHNHSASSEPVRNKHFAGESLRRYVLHMHEISRACTFPALTRSKCTDSNAISRDIRSSPDVGSNECHKRSAGATKEQLNSRLYLQHSDGRQPTRSGKHQEAHLCDFVRRHHCQLLPRKRST